jgi:chromosome partitioning protein
MAHIGRLWVAQSGRRWVAQTARLRLAQTTRLPVVHIRAITDNCPPNFNIVTKTALVASDSLLIPAIPDYLSTLGIDQLQRHVRQLASDFNSYAKDSGGDWPAANPKILGVIPTMVRMYRSEPIAAQGQYISQPQRSGVPVFDTVIRKNDTKYADAPQYGVPVVLQSAYGQTYESVRGELKNMTSEFLRRLATLV